MAKRRLRGTRGKTQSALTRAAAAKTRRNLGDPVGGNIIKNVGDTLLRALGRPSPTGGRVPTLSVPRGRRVGKNTSPGTPRKVGPRTTITTTPKKRATRRSPRAV